MECYCYLRNVQDLLADGKTPYERRFVWIISRSNYSIRCTGGMSPKLRDRRSENPSIRIESITRNLSRTCFDRGSNLEGRHSDCWYWGIRKIGCVRNLSQKTERKGSPDNPQRRRICIAAKLPERDYEFQEPTLRRKFTVRRENLSGESQGDKEEFQSEETKDDAEARKDFWSILGDFIYRRRKKNLSLFHWSILMSSSQLVQIWTLHKKNELMTVGMSTEAEICQIRGRVSQDFSCWTKLLRKDMWSGRRLTTIQTTSRPDHIWPDAWTTIGKAAQRTEKTEWAIEKPKLGHAR